MHQKNFIRQQEFSDDLKELIQSMLQMEPLHRPTVSEIWAHPWMCENTPLKQEIKNELLQRKQVVDEKLKVEREARNFQKGIKQNMHKIHHSMRDSISDKEIYKYNNQ